MWSLSCNSYEGTNAVWDHENVQLAGKRAIVGAPVFAELVIYIRLHCVKHDGAPSFLQRTKPIDRDR